MKEILRPSGVDRTNWRLHRSMDSTNEVQRHGHVNSIERGWY